MTDAARQAQITGLNRTIDSAHLTISNLNAQARGLEESRVQYTEMSRQIDEAISKLSSAIANMNNSHSRPYKWFFYEWRT